MNNCLQKHFMHIQIGSSQCLAPIRWKPHSLREHNEICLISKTLHLDSLNNDRCAQEYELRLVCDLCVVQREGSNKWRWILHWYGSLLVLRISIRHYHPQIKGATIVWDNQWQRFYFQFLKSKKILLLASQSDWWSCYPAWFENIQKSILS